MKFRILILSLCLVTFTGAWAQDAAPDLTPETPEVPVIIDLPGFPASGDIVEDIALAQAGDEQPPAELLASNLQLPDEGGGTTNPEDDDFDLWAWLTEFLAGLVPESVLGYIGAFLLVGETVVRLTPTPEDDKWFLWVKRIIDTIFPSRKKGGGTFPKADKTPI